MSHLSEHPFACCIRLARARESSREQALISWYTVCVSVCVLVFQLKTRHFHMLIASGQQWESLEWCSTREPNLALSLLGAVVLFFLAPVPSIRCLQVSLVGAESPVQVCDTTGMAQLWLAWRGTGLASRPLRSFRVFFPACLSLARSSNISSCSS